MDTPTAASRLPLASPAAVGRGSLRLGRLAAGRLLAALVVAALVGLAPPAAHAQGSTSYWVYSPTDFQPAFSTADLQVFRDILRLGDEEWAVVQELYEQHRATLKEEGRAVRLRVLEEAERMELFRDREAYANVSAVLERWRERKEQFDDAFLEELSVLLTAEQEARWPLVERELRRYRTLGEGWWPGETVDVSRLVRGSVPAEFVETETVRAILQDYVAELDRALVERNNYVERNSDEFEEAVEEDPDRARRLFETSRSKRQAIAAINARTVERVASAIERLAAQGEGEPGDAATDEAAADPIAAAEELRAEFRNRRFSRHFPTGRAEELLTSAIGLESLSPDRRRLLKAEREAFDEWLGPWKQRVAELVLTRYEQAMPWKLAEALDDGEGWDGDQQNEAIDEDHPMHDLQQERYEREVAIRKRVQAILTPGEFDLAMERSPMFGPRILVRYPGYFARF